MKAIAIVFGTLLLVGLVSIKAAVAMTFLGICSAICLWINAKVRVPRSTKKEVETDDSRMLESYDGNFDRDTLY